MNHDYEYLNNSLLSGCTSHRDREVCKRYAEHLINAESAKWISVNDRLPANKTFVLAAWMDDDPPVSAYYCTNRGRKEADWYDSQTFEVLAFCGDGDESTHWMPLPNPPKERKENT